MQKNLNPFARQQGARVKGDPVEVFYLFVNWEGHIVPYNAKHAILFGGFMPEYLGRIETNDPSIFEKSPDEVRKMNLDRETMPKDPRRTLIRQGGKEDVYETHDDIRRIVGKRR